MKGDVMNAGAALCLFTLAAFPVAGQTGSTSQVFEAASIKSAKPINGYTGIPPAIVKNEVSLRFPNATLRGLIMRAYEISFEDIMGPSWIDEERYEVSAKAAAGSQPNEVAAMLQNLLTERFGLRAHWTKNSTAGYALVVNSKTGLKIKPAYTAERATPRGGDSKGEQSSVAVTMADPSKGDQSSVAVTMTGHSQGEQPSVAVGLAGHFEFKHTSLEVLARNLSQMIGSPVVDATGLKGAFDITLNCDPSSLAGMPSRPTDATGTASAPSVFTAIRELGLDLQPRESGLKRFVIDSARKTPSEN
jgi:uncharacterized protein (TIGR03435 family)